MPRAEITSYKPVSYTHLDVYKRQHFSFVFRAGFADPHHAALLADGHTFIKDQFDGLSAAQV